MFVLDGDRSEVALAFRTLSAVHDHRVLERDGLELERDGERPQDVLGSGKPDEGSRSVELGLGNADTNPAVGSSPAQRTLASEKSFSNLIFYVILAAEVLSFKRYV